MTDLRFTLLVTALVLAVTQVPFEWNRAHTPEGRVFTESLVFQADYSIYFSFVRQAAEGSWWFENRVTSEAHPPMFVNLLWLALGKLQGAFDLSLPVLFHLWRVLGAVAILAGFAFAASVHLDGLRARRLALVTFATGGGLGWIFVVLRWLGLPYAQGGWWLGIMNAPADTFAAIHPFMQIFLFPFHACSSGLWLVTIAVYALAERRGSTRGRVVAGLLCVVLGSVRPHEMTAAVTAIGLYALACARRDGLFSPATFARLWILALPLPVIGYFAYIVVGHPIFKGMHAQNVLPPLLPLDLALTLGLVLPFAAVKLPTLARLARRDPAAGVLASSAVAVLGLFYAYPLFRYSLEFANMLVAPILLIAFLPRDAAKEEPLPWSGRALLAAIAVLLVVNTMTSVWLVGAKSREWRLPGSAAFVDRGVLEALRWLEASTSRSDVVLSLVGNGHWILRYGGNKVFLASPVSTLGYSTKRKMAQAFFDPATPASAKVAMLGAAGIAYVFVGAAEKRAGFDAAAVPGLERVFANAEAEIYRFAGETSAS